MSDSEDEDLKKAIALSLQESGPKSRKPQPTVIDLVSDDEDSCDDDNLDAPATVRPTRTPTQPATTSKVEVQVPGDVPKRSVQSSSGPISPPGLTENMKGNTQSVQVGILGLDRKMMEEERLARLAQQKGAAMMGSAQELHQQIYESKKRKPSTDALSQTDRPDTESKKQKTHMSSTVGSGLQYPNGAVKRTWVSGCPRTGDDIKIEEVLQKDDLELAVLSAFQIESDWIMNKLNDDTKVIWVLQAKTEAEKQNWHSAAPNNYRFCFPNMQGNINCMHSKLQLLAYPTHLRVVVPSANLTSYDWGETGVMENVLFLIDLPRLSDSNSTEPTDFGNELTRFLTAMGLEQKVVDSIKKFDFTRTKDLAFVHSIGGSHTGSGWKSTGYAGLGAAITKLGLDMKEAPYIDFLAASIGSLNYSFIKTMFLAAQGDDGLIAYGWRIQQSAKGSQMDLSERELSDQLKTRCRIYFPTQETLEKSKGGIRAGGTICLQRRWYESSSFPRSLMRDCKSRREGILMHSKMIFVRPPPKMATKNRAWAYIGSANLSESAWGNLVKDKVTKGIKLNCRNWECGVIVPVPAPTSESNFESSSTESSAGMDVFRGVIPIPMEVPGKEYMGKQPWFFNEL